MEIKTLSSSSKVEIYNAFEKSFENYVIPLTLQKETTLKRWENSSVNFDLSYGAFEQTRIVAFILHASYGNNLHNFTTGVIPSHRGQHLIEKISDVVAQNISGFKTYSLEVIKENFKAINLYRKLHFEITREIVSVTGKLEIKALPVKNLQYNILPLTYTQELDSLRLAHPAMENSKECLEKVPHLHELHELRDDGELLAYAIYSPESLTLREIGAQSDSELDQLLLQMKLNTENLRVMNIDSNSKLLSYFPERGLKPFVTQYEMLKEL